MEVLLKTSAGSVKKKSEGLASPQELALGLLAELLRSRRSIERVSGAL
jgi:hypothetical protein